MKRLALLGLLLGMANGVAPTLTLYLMYRAAPDPVFGWFAYEPLDQDVAIDYYGLPWEYAVVPVVLSILNMLLLPFAVHRVWLRGQPG